MGITAGGVFGLLNAQRASEPLDLKPLPPMNEVGPVQCLVNGSKRVMWRHTPDIIVALFLYILLDTTTIVASRSGAGLGVEVRAALRVRVRGRGQREWIELLKGWDRGEGRDGGGRCNNLANIPFWWISTARTNPSPYSGTSPRRTLTPTPVLNPTHSQWDYWMNDYVP